MCVSFEILRPVSGWSMFMVAVGGVIGMLFQPVEKHQKKMAQFHLSKSQSTVTIVIIIITAIVLVNGSFIHTLWPEDDEWFPLARNQNGSITNMEWIGCVYHTFMCLVYDTGSGGVWPEAVEPGAAASFSHFRWRRSCRWSRRRRRRRRRRWKKW